MMRVLHKVHCERNLRKVIRITIRYFHKARFVSISLGIHNGLNLL